MSEVEATPILVVDAPCGIYVGLLEGEAYRPTIRSRKFPKGYGARDISSFPLLAVEPLHKSTGFDLAKQPRVNEVFRVGTFGPRIGFGDLSYSELHVFAVRIRNSFECRGINPLRFLKHCSFDDTPVTYNNTLPLHDALPIAVWIAGGQLKRDG